MCLVGVKTGRMKNRERKIWWKMLFSTVWLRKENRRDRKQRRNFSLLDPLFLSSQIGRKMEREKSYEMHFTQILSHLPPQFNSLLNLITLPDEFCLFSSLSLYLLTAQQHLGSLLSLFFFKKFLTTFLLVTKSFLPN